MAEQPEQQPSLPTTTTKTSATSDNNNGDDMPEDATETRLGIVGYRTRSVAGFGGVLKGRFSDFLVHEVSLDGTKAELTSLDGTILNVGSDETEESNEQIPVNIKNNHFSFYHIYKYI